MNYKSTIALAAGPALLAGSVYFFNPANTASLDPRARLLGFKFYSVPSVSNSPTLVPGDQLFVSTFAYAFRGVSRRDMIVFVGPHNSLAYVKRVIAFGGETIEMVDGDLLINGEVIDEPYIDKNLVVKYKRFRQYKVPEGHLFVLGDNRDNSQDSRHYGAIAPSSVIGKVVTKFNASWL